MSSFFVNGGMAWATLFLVSIPIIIHLINRRRFFRMDWAAMEFLLDALKRNRRRLRIEQLILLLLRILLMALLGLFLARPFLSESGFGWLASVLSNEEKIFIVDDSFSTSHREAGRTSFDRQMDALELQVSKLADRGGGDRLTILKGSRYRSPLVRGVFVDRDREANLRQRISTLAPNDTQLPLAPLLESIADAGGEEGPTLPRLISILTDLRATDWTDGADGPREELQRALERVTGNPEVPTRLVVLDTGSDETGNIAVTGATVEGGKPVQDLPADIRVEIRNFGTLAARGLGIRLRYAPAPAVSEGEVGVPEDGTAWTTAIGPPVDELPPGGTGVYSIPCTFRSTGYYGVHVEVTGANDALAEDNTFPLAVEVVEGTDVLVITGEPSSEQYEGEADFLAQALAPTGEVSSGVRPTIVGEENLPRSELEKYAIIFALNVHSFPQEFLPLLGRYVRSGGTLVVFPGDQVDAALYNRQLGPPAEGDDPAPHQGLLPARLGEIAGNPESPLSLKLEVDQPYFRVLRELGELLSMVHVYRYYDATPLPTARILGRFSDTEGSPAVVEHAVDDGRVILFATTADLEWNDWPRNPTYLMVLQEMVTAVVRSRTQQAMPLVGATLRVPVDISRYSQEARLRSPGYPTRPATVLSAAPAPAGSEEGSSDQAAFDFVLDDTTQAGLYALELNVQAGGTEWREIALRRDPRESDLARVSEARIRELYPEADITVVKDPAAFSDVGRGGFEASDLLLWAFIGLLFIETLLARYFAHHVSSAPAESRGGAS